MDRKPISAWTRETRNQLNARKQVITVFWAVGLMAPVLVGLKRAGSDCKKKKSTKSAVDRGLKWMVEIGFCLGSVTWLLIEWLRFFLLCFFTCSKFHSNPRLYPLTHTVPHQSPLSFQFSLLTPHSSLFTHCMDSLDLTLVSLFRHPLC